jgi:RES domain-containing protein
LTIYRVCTSRHPENAGEGSRLYGGRWNHKGTAVLYCAATVSLCELEILANSAKLPVDRMLIRAEVPDSLPVLTIRDADLPPDWNDLAAPLSTKDIGTNWVLAKTTTILSVPSVVVPQERNFILNPAHPDFRKIRFSAPEPLEFDPRLKS